MFFSSTFFTTFFFLVFWKMTTPSVRALKEAVSFPLSYLFKKDLSGRMIRDSIKIADADHGLYTMKMPLKMVIATKTPTAREVLTNTEAFRKSNGTEPDGSRMKGMSKLLDPLNNVEGGYEQKNLVSAEGEVWSKQRKIMNPSFTTDSLHALVPAFRYNTEIVLKKWDRFAEEQKPINICSDMSHFAVEVLGEAILGKAFGTLEEGASPIYDHYTNIMRALGEPIWGMIPLLEALPLPRNIKLKNSVQYMRNEFEQAVKERQAHRKAMTQEEIENFQPKNLLDYLIPADGGQGLSYEELIPNLWVFFVAGHDTTAISLMWTLRFMGMFPDVQEKAREEALSVIGLHGSCSASDISDAKLPYIASVIKESLRLQPPIHTLLTRMAAKDCELGNYLVPRGTIAAVAISAINRDPENWENPNAFLPERYLTEKRAFNPSPFKWLPFSGGHRRCLGDRFSLLEQKTFLAQLLTHFKFESADGLKGGGEKGRQDMTEDILERSKGTFELLFNQPKEVNLNFTRL